MMQLRPKRQTLGQFEAPHTCPEGFSVCPKLNAPQRCEKLASFTKSGGALGQGTAALKTCTCNWHAPVNPACFEAPPSADVGEFFEQYAEGYAEDGGTHTAFMWSGETSFTNQSSRELIKDYYWQFIGRYAKDFQFTVYPETFNVPFAQKYNSCAVVPTSSNPGYLGFGFASDNLTYGAGFAILDQDGKIVRQYATADGSPVQTASTPGYVADIPKCIETEGPVATVVQRYWETLLGGSPGDVASLYDPSAKVFFLNTVSAGQFHFQVYEGKESIASYAQQLGAYASEQSGHTGGADLAIRFGEEMTAKVPGNAYSAYRFGAAKYSQSLVFNEAGAIWGEFVVADMPGFGAA